MTRDRWIVLTTIQHPTPALAAMAELCSGEWGIVAVGDINTPADWKHSSVEFLSVERQKDMFGAFAAMIPYRHYCRKNLGYLYAFQNGAKVIIDIDDDNIPYELFARGLDRTVTGRLLDGATWVNVYKHFIENTRIWPRGLPLDEIESTGNLSTHARLFTCPIQQFLADNDPDVDAIFRLTTTGEFFFRKDTPPVVLERECWSPFNSQNTVFFAEAFPLLYLPCHVSFRMTDIWRSFVAQAALWHHDLRVSFHAPTVEQRRNQHDLTKDLTQELIGYVNNRKIARTLSEVRQTISFGDSLENIALKLWQSLESIGIIPPEEMAILREWLTQCRSIVSSPRSR
jgi:STELLO glycosyltransferases